MHFEFNVCFDLGYTVDDMTWLYSRLVSIFGVGGRVERDVNGKVIDFLIATQYGLLRLHNNDSLYLCIGDSYHSHFGGDEEFFNSPELDCMTIYEIHRKLMQFGIVRSNKGWKIILQRVIEMF